MTATRNQRDQAGIAAMKDSPAAFRKSLRIDVSGKPTHLRNAVKVWQEKDFLALDETWRCAIGLPPRGPVFPHSWLGRGRGCSKSTDTAVNSCWAVYASQSATVGYVIAAAKDQARLIIRFIRKLLQLNPWLRSTVDVQRNTVRNRETGAELTILPAEANLIFGVLADFVICDELTNWGPAGEETWQAIFSASGKRENCCLVVISNSGVLGSWQHQVFEAIVNSPDAYHSQTNAEQTLLSERQLSAQRRMLPPLVFARLFENRWIPDSADGLDEQALRACVHRYAFPIDPAAYANRGLVYIAGADLAATTDAAAVSIWAVDGQANKIRLAWSKEFQPKNGEVDLVEVVNVIRMLHQKYRPTSWRMDSFESRRLSQELRRMGIIVQIESFQGNAAAVQASALVGAVNTQQIVLPESEPGLLAQFRALSLKESSNGILRIHADRTARGHCDQAFSCIVALPAAQELASHRTWNGPIEIHSGRSKRPDPLSRHIPLARHNRTCRSLVALPKSSSTFFSSNPRFNQ